MPTTVELYTRDLRVRDNPALYDACRRGDQVVPPLVLDPSLKPPANRRRFLIEALADLRASLRRRRGDLVLRTACPAPLVPIEAP